MPFHNTNHTIYYLLPPFYSHASHQTQKQDINQKTPINASQKFQIILKNF